MICAALLHDVIEDTDITNNSIAENFNFNILELVYSLTDISTQQDGNRKIRKEIDRKHISQGSPKSKTIKLADLIDNAKTISEHDPSFAKVYMNEMRDLLEVLKEGNQILFNRAKKLVEDHFNGQTNT